MPGHSSFDVACNRCYSDARFLGDMQLVCLEALLLRILSGKGHTAMMTRPPMLLERGLALLLQGQLRAAIAPLRSDESHMARRLAETLFASGAHQVSAREKAWIERIEALRSRLHASPTEIQVIDYGAGDTDLARSDAEMHQGREVTLSIQQISQQASKPYRWALLLCKLVQAFRPACCLELGTSLGLSAAYQAAALQMNQQGRLVSLEGAPTLAVLAGEHMQILGLDNVRIVAGRFQDTLSSVLQECAPIDYAFIDGHHDEQATIAYFETILPALAQPAVLVFDDIAWSPGMQRAWAQISAHAQVAVAVDLRVLGICIIDSQARHRHRLKLRQLAALHWLAPQPPAARR